MAVVEDPEGLGVLSPISGISSSSASRSAFSLSTPIVPHRPLFTPMPLGNERFDRLQHLHFVERRVERFGRRFFLVLQPDRRRVARLDLDDRAGRAKHFLDSIAGAAPL